MTVRTSDWHCDLTGLTLPSEEIITAVKAVQTVALVTYNDWAVFDTLIVASNDMKSGYNETSKSKC